MPPRMNDGATAFHLSGRTFRHDLKGPARAFASGGESAFVGRGIGRRQSLTENLRSQHVDDTIGGVMRLLQCPTCGTRFEAALSTALPFCCERCRKIDLGRWLNEEHGVPWEREEPDEADELDLANENQHQTEWP